LDATLTLPEVAQVLRNHDTQDDRVFVRMALGKTRVLVKKHGKADLNEEEEAAVKEILALTHPRLGDAFGECTTAQQAGTPFSLCALQDHLACLTCAVSTDLCFIYER
jgi:hypothetical protein